MNALWYNLSCHSHVENAFLFLSKSRLSARVPRDCDKHEKQQVGGSLIRGTMFKRCTKCGKLKLFTEFSRTKKNKSGRVAVCLECVRQHNKQWYADNIERERKKRRVYREENIDDVRSRGRQYAKEHKEQNKLNMRKWRAENPEKNRESWTKWKKENRNRINELDRIRRRNNLEKDRVKSANRRALVKGCAGKITAAEIEELKAKQGYMCLACGRREPEIQLTHDHVKPIVMGGENTKANSQMLCKSCNSKKGGKWIDYRKG